MAKWICPRICRKIWRLIELLERPKGNREDGELSWVGLEVEGEK